MLFYVGTLTREGGEGILQCRLTDQGIMKIKVIRNIIDPNYVILSGNKKRLFSVNSNRQGADMKGGVSEYDVSGSQPQLVSQQYSDGNAPCFLTLDDGEKHLYLANYGTGSLCVYPTEQGLKAHQQYIQHSGSGPHPIRQTSSHVHQVTFIPGTHDLAACDLGTDQIVVYRANSESGKLTEHSRTHIPGGPRHIAYASSERAYLANELSNEVVVLAIHDGIFSIIQKLSTLPVGFAEKNTASAIRISADGQKVYVSNRGHGSIVEYFVEPNGKLTLNRWIEAGIFPRDFQILDDGSFLVADQRAGVRLIHHDGIQQAFLEENGAVCIAL